MQALAHWDHTLDAGHWLLFSRSACPDSELAYSFGLPRFPNASHDITTGFIDGATTSVLILYT